MVDAMLILFQSERDVEDADSDGWLPIYEDPLAHHLINENSSRSSKEGDLRLLVSVHPHLPPHCRIIYELYPPS